MSRPGTWGQPRQQPSAPVEAVTNTPAVAPEPGGSPPGSWERAGAGSGGAPDGRPYTRPSMAGLARVLSIIGLFLCLFGQLGLFLGLIELRAIDNGHSDPTARPKARAAVIIGLVATLLNVLLLAMIVAAGVMSASSGTTS